MRVPDKTRQSALQSTGVGLVFPWKTGLAEGEPSGCGQVRASSGSFLFPLGNGYDCGWPDSWLFVGRGGTRETLGELERGGPNSHGISTNTNRIIKGILNYTPRDTLQFFLEPVTARSPEAVKLISHTRTHTSSFQPWNENKFVLSLL